ncbi:hypothetical protein CPB84DRAFT_1964660 [Gymnopilus junonius]|uniref:F-box domain-containing protein n=1 Tax=Gymnopilus junonius TaxID=109634 RepID=A0A9P5NGA5_GYMJU|nr:hypothetical protein CPB84DRAFT_1964660 [Gymnopilus junonius]
MISCIKIPEVTTLDPYMQSLRTQFNIRLVPSKKNVVNTMPPEVLAEIFLKLLEDDDTVLRHSARPLVSSTCQSDPLLFGQVCSYWRNVALSTPSLWARIYILKPQKSQVRLTQLWLERARTHALDLSIWAPDVEQCDRFAINDIISLFMKRRQYWLTISFTIELRTLTSLSLVVQPAPNLHLLKSATLWVENASDKAGKLDPTVDEMWKTIHTCKALKYVDWGTSYRHGPPEHCPWNQLTGLTLSSTLSFSQLLSILSLTPHLEFLFAPSLFSDSSDSSALSLTPSPVTHARLKTFKIASNQETGPLFRLLSLPALQLLKICNNFEEDVPRDLPGFQEFLEKSNPQQLTTFELEDFYLHEEDLRKYLISPQFCNLRRIVLFTEITDKVLHQLADIDKEGRHKVFPSLQVFCTSSASQQTRDGLLSNMIASRFSPTKGRGLKEIGLYTGNLGPIDRLAISDMFKQGLDGSRMAGVYDR